MKKILFFAIASISLLACNNNQPDKDTSIMTTTKTDSTYAVTDPVTANSGNTNLQSGIPIQNSNMPSSLVPQQTSASNQSPVSLATNTKANPPHGQPGHVCETPNSTAPTQTIAAPQQNKSVPQIVSSPVQNIVPTGKGLNPAHGQPGHRCDISVGESLSSPAKKAAPATISPASAPQILPATQPNTVIAPSISPAINSMGAKLNPAHGEPGHDCKIGVGQPLKN